MNGEFGDLTDNITIIRRAFSGVASSAAIRKDRGKSRKVPEEKKRKKRRRRRKKRKRRKKKSLPILAFQFFVKTDLLF